MSEPPASRPPRGGERRAARPLRGERDLAVLLASLDPQLAPGTFVFALAPDGAVPPAVEPFATVREAEGLTIVLRSDDADRASLPYDGEFARITLRVHSALDAVGLTAAVSAALAQHDISANVIAGVHHDHIFVAASRAADAMRALQTLAADPYAGVQPIVPES